MISMTYVFSSPRAPWEISLLELIRIQLHRQPIFLNLDLFFAQDSSQYCTRTRPEKNSSGSRDRKSKNIKRVWE